MTKEIGAGAPVGSIFTLEEQIVGGVIGQVSGRILKGAMPIRVRPPAPAPIIKSEASSAVKPVMA